MLRLALLLCVACSQKPEPAKPKRSGMPAVPVTCRIEPEAVRCSATNPHADSELAIARASVYLGVRRTGRLISKDRVVLLYVEPNRTAETTDVVPGRPADLCGADPSGCALLVVDDATPGKPSIYAFARELEASAPEAGRTHPTLVDCEAMRLEWRADVELLSRLQSFAKVLEDPELWGLLCLRLDRASFECFRAGRSQADFDACPQP